MKELKDLFATKALENDKVCKKLEVYKKVIEDLTLVDGLIVASIEDNGANSTCITKPHAPDVRIHEQQSHSLYFSNHMVH